MTNYTNYKENESILKIENLYIKRGKEFVIENLSLSVEKKDFFTILGPNGAGKSTLLKAIIGTIPYQGEIVIKKGVKISYLPERLARDKFKEIPLNIREFFRIKEASLKETKEILSMVEIENLDNLLPKNPGELSSGQFQKMLIAWSLVKKPDLLLFDEPTTGVDIGSKQTVYSLLEKFREKWGLTIIMVTHDLNVVYSYSNKVLCLYRKANCLGKPQEVLTPQKLQELYKSPVKFYKHTHSL